MRPTSHKQRVLPTAHSCANRHAWEASCGSCTPAAALAPAVRSRMIVPEEADKEEEVHEQPRRQALLLCHLGTWSAAGPARQADGCSRCPWRALRISVLLLNAGPPAASMGGRCACLAVLHPQARRAAGQRAKQVQGYTCATDYPRFLYDKRYAPSPAHPGPAPG